MVRPASPTCALSQKNVNNLRQTPNLASAFAKIANKYLQLAYAQGRVSSRRNYLLVFPPLTNQVQSGSGMLHPTTIRNSLSEAVEKPVLYSTQAIIIRVIRCPEKTRASFRVISIIRRSEKTRVCIQVICCRPGGAWMMGMLLTTRGSATLHPWLSAAVPSGGLSHRPKCFGEIHSSRIAS